MSQWETIWGQREIFIDGFLTTLVLFVVASIISFIIGFVLLYRLERARPVFKYLIQGMINIIRTIPFLILVYLFYYGLPQVGVRMDAFEAGLLSLCLYHSMYFCEIFRGVRKSLDPGYIEAAHACGFSQYKIFLRIILPNVCLRSLPLIANQLIICLKDTAFLSIITVAEITAAANSVQSTYFIPMKAFVVAIALYWLISLTVELVIKRISIKAQQKGLNYA